LVTEYLELARAAGAVPGQRTPSLEVPEEILRTGRKTMKDFRLLSGMPIVGLCPGSEYGPSKRWPADRFVEAGSRLADAGAKIAVFGAPSETALAEEVARRIKGAESLAGRTSVIGLGACLALCDVVVANDSGAAHMAAAVGTPVVALFTSSDPAWTRPLGAGVRVIRADADCAPCFNRECDIGYPCLTGISAARVAETALSLVKGSLRRPPGDHRSHG
jgi:heptosyltransferase-2